MTQINYKLWDNNVSSTFDILFKDFFNQNSTFNSPVDNKIGHPVDIYETQDGLFFEIACTGLNKSDVEINVEGDVLRIVHNSEDRLKKDPDNLRVYHKGIAKRSFNLGYKIARRFDLDGIDAKMQDGLLTINIPHTEENKPTKIKIK